MATKKSTSVAKKANAPKTSVKKSVKQETKKTVTKKSVKPIEKKSPKKKDAESIYAANVSIVVAMAVEALILLLGYLIIVNG